MTRDTHVLGFALDHPWAIDPAWLPVIAQVLARHAAARDVDEATMQAALIQRKNLPQSPGGGVAVIPVYGVIAPRANALTSMSGGTSFGLLGEQLAAAVADPKVTTIILDVDSPGGSVAGAPEFAAQLRAARTKKPIIAQAQFKMGSAAYWLAASATKIHAAPSAVVGSIGIYRIHEDMSKALASEGVTRTYISAGKHKVDGNEVTPLTDDVLAVLRAPVDAAYATFVGDIAKGRGVPVASVRNGYGEGKTVTADEALSLGMIDAIATLDDTVARAMKGAASDPALAATADTPQEPVRATGQDLRWAHQRQVLDLALALL
jgi:signal peptide peptidase SppA